MRTQEEVEAIEELDTAPRCDIGNFNNFTQPPCPNDSAWHLWYACCNRGNLLCEDHKNQFLKIADPFFHQTTKSQCPHCKSWRLFRDIFRMERL